MELLCAIAHETPQLTGGAKTGHITIRDLFTGSIKKTFPLYGVPTDMVIHPNGRHIFVSIASDGIYSVHASSGKQQQFMRYAGCTCLDIAPIGDFIVAGHKNGVADVWALSKAKKEEHVGRLQHDVRITDVKFEKKTNNILTAGVDQLINRWNFQGQHLQCFEGHTSEVTRVATFDNPRGIMSCGGRDDGTLKIWQADTGIPVVSQLIDDKGITAFAGHAETMTFYVGTRVGDIHKVEITPQGVKIAIFDQYVDPISALWLSPSGKYLVAATLSDIITLYNNTPGVVERRVSVISTDQPIIAIDVFLINKKNLAL